MFQEARAEGVFALAAFLGLCETYAWEAKRALRAGMGNQRSVERDIPSSVAAERLGISLRKLTRERFSTYRDICVPIEGQTRGYVVNERALAARIARQRQR